MTFTHDPGRCVILVGGLGTRLGALTANTPKPLLSVAGRPFLHWLIDYAALQGFRDFLCLAGFRGEQVAEAVGDGSLWGLRVEHRCEAAPAGTAGALAEAADLLSDDFTLTNGDSLFACPWTALPPPPAGGMSVALRAVPDASRYGMVTLEGPRIIAFAEKRPDAGPGLINGGVYRVNRTILDRIDRSPCSLESDIMPVLVKESRLTGHTYAGGFIDIGVPDTFAEAQSYVPSLIDEARVR